MSEDCAVVLLGDDDPICEEIIRRSLRHSSVANCFKHVEDGEQVLDYLYQRGNFTDPELAPQPDLVLLDFRMPKIDALGVLKVIKTDSSLQHIPVLILSCSEEDIAVADAYIYRANSYLVKPLRLESFAKTMDVVINYWLRWNRKAWSGCPTEAECIPVERARL